LFLPYVPPLSLPSNSALCLSSFVPSPVSPLYLSSLSLTLSLLSVSPLFSASSPPLYFSSSVSIPLSLTSCLFPSVYTQMYLLSASSLCLSLCLSTLSLYSLFPLGDGSIDLRVDRSTKLF
jgi:hypothetical protein